MNMKRILGICTFIIFVAGQANAGFLDDLFKAVTASDAGKTVTAGAGTDQIVEGLKDALRVGTERAVAAVSRQDGFLKNADIKIPVPDKIRTVTDVLSRFGFSDQVDGFIESMNRAAEKAAPAATDYFVDAVKEMKIPDAKKILDGGDNAATDYFREKTYDKLFNAFKPSVADSMNRVGAVASYNNLMDTYRKLPLSKDYDFRLEDYVTSQAIDGLFYMVAQEEEKIRHDPAARVTEILKKVFTR